MDSRCWHIGVHIIRVGLEITKNGVLRRMNRDRQIMGQEVVVAITDGKLDFGPWEQIFYGEFDGRRDKRVLVKVIGE